jgi:hypothetical protein
MVILEQSHIAFQPEKVYVIGIKKRINRLATSAPATRRDRTAT